MSEKLVKSAAAPTVLVKGGTSSSSYDNMIAKKEADANARRSYQDKQYAKAQEAPKNGAVARMGSHKMITQESPRLVLKYLNRDRSVRQECISEVTLAPTQNGELDPMFTLVCPHCLERGLPQDECQLMVRNSHRKWHLDEKFKHHVERVVDPFTGEPMAVIIAGKVTVEETVKCSNYNCNWRVKIDGSNVIPV